MSESEAMLHEANRRAHRVARAALAFRAQDKDWGLDYLAPLPKERKEFDKALDAYERIEIRRQKEATL